MDKEGSRTRQDRRRLQTRKLLVDTAIALVLEKGYDALSVQDVTDRADLGRGTFYLYFKDKSEAVWAAVEEAMEELERKAHERIDEKSPNADYAGLLFLFRHAKDNRDLFRAVLGGRGSAALAGRVQDLLAAMFLRDIKRASAPGQRDPELPDEVLAQMLSGTISRLLFWWLDSSRPQSADRMAAMAYRFLYRREPPAAPEKRGR